MKKVFLSFGIVLLMIGNSISAQQLTVAVSPFDARGGFTKDDAEAVYELFVGELAVSGPVRVVDRGSFDKIMTEMKFQQSDWADSQKVAQLGRAMNANSIIRGQLMSLGGKLVITASVLDINTAQILSSSRLQLNNIGEVFDGIGGFVRDITKNLPSPPDPPGVYRIGGRGPGGGIVFYAEGGSYMEVSGFLGAHTWNDALAVARNYRGGNYSNWHLPTRSELDLIYRNLRTKNLDDLGNDYYWSSSAYNIGSAWWQSFSDGSQHHGAKNSTGPVRAVRAF
jgi:TolB-like protein